MFSGEGPPYPQEGSSISYFNGSLYLFGYSLIQTLENDYVKNDIYRYDLDGNYWEVVEVKGDRPDGRVYHYSCIYNNELYIFFGLDYATFSEFKNFYKFNFEKSEWILVESDFGISNSQGAFVQVDNIVHFIHGRNLFEITNSIITLDLSKDNLGRNITSPYWISPSERIDHCGLVIGTNFYVFGGVMLRENDIKSYQNDIWAFDLEMKIWNPVNFFGDIPSQRASFACSKTNSETFAIFGGVSESGILDDLFIFHEPQRTWYRLNAENDFPSKRQSACIVFHENVLYIVGGRNNELAFNEIWTYSFITNRFELTNMKPVLFNGLGLHKVNCWIEQRDNYIDLFIAGGEDFYHSPNPELICFSIFSDGTFHYSNTFLGSPYNLTSVGSDTKLLITDNYMIRYGGVIYDYLALNSIMLYSRKAESSSESYASQLITLLNSTKSHSLVHFKRSFYSFSGIRSLEIFSSFSYTTRNLLEFTFINQSKYNISCSPGTIGKNCSLCKPGTYYENNKCKTCPPGKFNSRYASVGAETCSLCPFGSYSKTSGAHFCLKCPAGTICPIGSSKAKNFLNFPKNESIQPSSFKTKQNFISGISNYLWYSFSVFGIIVILIAVNVSNFHPFLKKIDLFVDQHENSLDVPVIHKKTLTGGAFSVAFVLFVIVSVVVSVLTYRLDNVSEIRTLIPVILLEDEITADDFKANVVFYFYGGECVDLERQGNQCHKRIHLEQQGVSFYHKTLECSFEEGDCKISVRYKNFKLTSKSAKIEVRMEESSSSANAISLNLTSSSSIPGKTSSLSTIIQPYSNEFLFKGLEPSKFYFKFIPSVKKIQIFESESNEWPSLETGFLISEYQNHQSGAVSSYET